MSDDTWEERWRNTTPSIGTFYPPTEKKKEKDILATMIYNAIQYAKDVQKDADGYMVVTKLREAMMWLEESR